MYVGAHDTDRKKVEEIQCSSVTAACSHTERSGPHRALARRRRAQPSGLVGAAKAGCTKPAVQTNRRMHSHRNSNGSTGNRLVTGSLR